MANYLYVFRGGDMARMSPQQMEENMKKWGAWMGQLSQSGNFKGGDPLAEGGRVVAGKKKATKTKKKTAKKPAATKPATKSMY